MTTQNEHLACSIDGKTRGGLTMSIWFLAPLLAFFLACGNDMGNQPSWKPQEMEVLMPERSIPVTGREEPVVEVESYSSLTNPLALDEDSVRKGQILFQRQCSPCHGKDGQGGGTMAAYFGEPPPLDDETNLELSDGFFYSTIRHGRGMMPAQSESLSTEERWLIVNYLRRLQNK